MLMSAQLCKSYPTLLANIPDISYIEHTVWNFSGLISILICDLNFDLDLISYT